MFFHFSTKLRYDGKNMDKWGYNYNVGKGEIARYKQFLLFPPCFQKQSVVDVLTYSHSVTPFDAPGKQAF